MELCGFMEDSRAQREFIWYRRIKIYGWLETKHISEHPYSMDSHN